MRRSIAVFVGVAAARGRRRRSARRRAPVGQRRLARQAAPDSRLRRPLADNVAHDTVTPAQLKPRRSTSSGRSTSRFAWPRRRTVRRADAALAVPALLEAVEAHTDGYVRFRALVLLSGFNDPRTRDVMLRRSASKNDRLRAVAYTYFEHNPDPPWCRACSAALDTEASSSCGRR